MITLIVASGEVDDYDLLEKRVLNSDYIIAVDGGMNHLNKINKNPNIIIGDLDSIDQNILKDINIKIKKYPQNKDKTDLELSIEHAILKGSKKIILHGVLGNRIDHSITNIFLLKKINKYSIPTVIENKKNTIYFIENKLELRNKGNYISIIPLERTKFKLEGFKYKLNNESLDFTSTRGISNEIIDDIGIIKVRSGSCLVIESRD